MIKITLRAARINIGMTQDDAAAQFGIHQATLAKYEQDSTNVPRPFYIKIEDVYGIPVENIFFGKLKDFTKDVLLHDLYAL